MFKTSISSAFWRLLCLVAFALCFGGVANAQQQTVLTVTALAPRNEGSNQQFRLSLNNPATQRLTVSFFAFAGTGQTAAITAPNGPFVADFNAIGRDYTFEANSSDLIVDVPTRQDQTYEFDENFQVVVQDPRYDGQTATNFAFSNGSSFSSDTVVGMILNDDVMPTVNLISPPAILEGDSGNRARQNDNFTLNVAAIAERPLTVSLSTSDGSATSSAPNADYVPVNADQVTIPAGTLQQPYSVVVLGDDIYEGDEAFSLTSTALPPTPGTASSTAVAVITDNDLPSYVIDDSLASVVEGQQASFRITLIDRATGQPISALSNVDFTYTYQDITATFGADYQDANATPFTGTRQGTFRIRPGQRDFVLPVPTTDDNIQEQVETFNLIIGAQPTNAQAPQGNGNIGFGQITDNDSAPQINVADARVTEGTGTPTAITFTVSLTSVTAQTVTVDYQTVNQAAAPGIASPGSDYNSTTGRVTFAANQASQTFTVPIIPDNINEPNETFRVRLFNPSNASFPNNVAEITATGTIVDDDTAGTVSMAQTNQSIVENSRAGVVNVIVNFTPNGTPARPVTVDFTTIPGTAVQSGQRDYFGKTGRLTFNAAAGNASVAIPIEIVNDNIREGDETFTVRLTAVDGADLLPNATDTVVTIIDDDPLPTVSAFPVSPIREDGGTKNFVVALNGQSQVPIVVSYAFADGTATNGLDYQGTSGTLTFQPGGARSFFVSARILEDNIAEGNETFSLVLSKDMNDGSFNLADNATTSVATIVDNDATPALTIGDAQVLEGNDGDINSGAVMNFNVSLTRPSSRPVSFTYSTLNLRQSNCTPSNGCDIASNDDYATMRNITLTLTPGQTSATIAIRIAPDALNEYNEQFSIVARALVNTVPSVTQVDSDDTNSTQRFGTVAYGTILNDDAGGVVILTGPFTDPNGTTPSGNLTEGYRRDANNAVVGDVGNFRVTLPTPAGRPVTVNYVLGAGTTAANANDINDITTGPGRGQVTFFAGDTTRNIALRAIADNVSEGDERLTVSISIRDNNGQNSYTTAPASSSVSTTIVDRTPVINSFAPTTGFPAYGNVPATRVTINGNRLRTDGNPRVDSVKFGNGGSVGRGGIQYTSDDALVVSVPNNAKSGPITLNLTDGTTVLGFPASGAGTVPNFIVQPVIESFTPTTGVRNATTVTINGRNFQDGLNQTNGVQFSNGVTVQNVTPISDTQIRVTVPANAVTGPLRIVATQGAGPASQTNFIVVNANPGSLRFADDSDMNPILEGSTGTINQPVRNFDGATNSTTHRPYMVFVNPAIQTTGDDTGQPIMQTPIIVRIAITDSTSGGRNPQIAVRADLTGAGRPTFIANSNNGIVDVRIPASYNRANPLEVAITDAGTDDLPPVVGTGAATVKVTAAIIASDTPAFFPLTVTGQEPSVTVQRREIETNANQATVLFAANTTTDFSVPFATNNSGSVAITDAFETRPTTNSGGTTVRNYTVYRFDASNQRNSRTPGNGALGSDFVALADTDRLQRGVGYRLVTGNNEVRLKAQGTGLQTISANTFSFNLTRNIPFAANASGTANANNGYNFIGFPFNNTQFTAVNFNNSNVTFNGNMLTLSQAAAAGLINPQLYTVNADGTLTAVTGTPTIQPFKAYFVQIFRDNLTLTLQDPTR